MPQTCPRNIPDISYIYPRHVLDMSQIYSMCVPYVSKIGICQMVSGGCQEDVRKVSEVVRQVSDGSDDLS